VYHIPVLTDELINFIKDVNLDKKRRVFVDATCGTGGHSEAILKNIKQTDILIGIDIDSEILGVAIERLRGFGNFFPTNKNYTALNDVLKTFGIEKIDVLVADLGVCSLHFDLAYRGFSIMGDSPLDMRYDRESRLTAWDVVNTFSYDDLKEIIWKFGEEKWSRKIAQNIVKAREMKSIDSTQQLAQIVTEAIPKKAQPRKIHPATKTFQAIRIFLNKELKNLDALLILIPKILDMGGRIGIISFHSLEDSIVKEWFNKYSRVCVCPPDFPVCQCGGQRKFQVLTKKPIRPSEEEVTRNPRSRSAKLRFLEKVAS